MCYTNEGEWIECYSPEFCTAEPPQPTRPCEDAPCCGCCPSDPDDTGMTKDDYVAMMMRDDYDDDRDFGDQY